MTPLKVAEMGVTNILVSEAGDAPDSLTWRSFTEEHFTYDSATGAVTVFVPSSYGRFIKAAIGFGLRVVK